MKRVRFLISVFVAVFWASAAMCQTSASAYFLEGSFDRYRLNPAFSPERSFLALPVLGGNGLNAEMNVGLADFLFESESHPGKLTTFMSSDISSDRFLNGLPERSGLSSEYGTDVLSFGFGREKWYAWFDSRLVARVGMSIPKEMFSFMKAGLSRGEYEIKDMNVTAASYLETALGFQYEPVRHLRVGAALKPLLGLAYADAGIDRLYASTAGSSWIVMADATVRSGVPIAEVVLEEGKISDVRTDGKFRLGPPNGFAIDLGVEYDFEGIVPGLKASASISDLGSIHWTKLQIFGTDVSKCAEFRGFLPDGSIEDFGDDLKDMMSLYDAGVGTMTQKLDATLRVGAEYSLPFLNCLSIGELYTRYGGNVDISESRTSLNLSLFRFLELSGNVAFSNSGHSFGGMINLHPAWLDFFFAVDMSKLEVNPQMIPVNGFSVDFRTGIRFAFSSLRY